MIPKYCKAVSQIELFLQIAGGHHTTAYSWEVSPSATVTATNENTFTSSLQNAINFPRMSPSEIQERSHLHLAFALIALSQETWVRCPIPFTLHQLQNGAMFASYAIGSNNGHFCSFKLVYIHLKNLWMQGSLDFPT